MTAAAPLHKTALAGQGVAGLADLAWFGRALGFLCSVPDTLDPACLPSWPGWASLPDTLAEAGCRGELYDKLLAPGDGDLPAGLAAFEQAGTRLLLLPPDTFRQLAAMTTAWITVPRLLTLLHRADIAAAAEALGGEAVSFGRSRARLLPRPPARLAEHLASELPDAGGGWNIAPGIHLLGQAIGTVPEVVLARLRLRSPAHFWTAICAACRDEREQPDALAAARRLVRELAPSCLAWLN